MLQGDRYRLRIQSVVTVRDFSSSATCYAESKDVADVDTSAQAEE